MSHRTCQIRVDQNELGIPVYHVTGTIDESADLSLLHEARGARVIFDLSEVRRINSFGVRSWMETMRQIPSQVRVTFVGCSPPVVDQCNLVVGFRGHADIESFHAPLICENCDKQCVLLFDAARCLALGAALPPTPCPNCGHIMEMDDLEEHYLHFLHAQLE
jgi:anti-anti-sigma regulatory factor